MSDLTPIQLRVLQFAFDHSPGCDFGGRGANRSHMNAAKQLIHQGLLTGHYRNATIADAGRDALSLTYASPDLRSRCADFKDNHDMGYSADDLTAFVASLIDSTIIECETAARGPVYKEIYNGSDRGNWSRDSDYGRGRHSAADAVRALIASTLPSTPRNTGEELRALNEEINTAISSTNHQRAED